MPDRHSLRAPRRARRRKDALTAAAMTFEREQTRSLRQRNPFSYTSWQEEVWAFYDAEGEFGWSVDWLTKAMSRVRLTAAEVLTGGDEPAVLDTGPAAEQIARLGAGDGGHGGILAALTPQLSVPGEGWLVGEQYPQGGESWCVRSTDEIRMSTARGASYEVREDDQLWRPLGDRSFVTRVWDPHPRLHYRATSAAQRALPILRRIDLLDRRITATLVSRLAMNGLLLIPQEGSFTTPKQYAESDDPFVAMLIDVASNNIKNPGSASAAIPMPVRFTKDLIEKWKHLTFGDGITKELLDERTAELRRLATAVNVPAEVVLGMGDINHWSAWQLEESAIKLHVSPLAELICNALTIGYLRPLLAADGAPLVGPNGGHIVCWYDTSELTARPDKTDPAFRAYDRFELSGEALRRETGFGEDDAPDNGELKQQILKRLATTIQLGVFALDQLTGGSTGAAAGGGTPDETPEAGPAGGPGAAPDEGDDPAAGPADGPDSGPSGGQRGTPGTRDAPPPPPNGDAAVAPAGWPAFIPPPDLETRQPVGAGAGPAANGNGHRGRES